MGRHKTKYNKHRRPDVKSYVEHKCPYCGQKLVFRTAEEMGIKEEDGVNFWACSNYPECDAYVRTNKGTQVPRGTVANKELRELRKNTHAVFNRLYTSGYMTKQDAYVWLKTLMGCTGHSAHIGQFSEYSCKLVIKEANKFIRNNPKYFGGKAG